MICGRVYCIDPDSIRLKLRQKGDISSANFLVNQRIGVLVGTADSAVAGVVLWTLVRTDFVDIDIPTPYVDRLLP